jgi:hypothetical protein
LTPQRRRARCGEGLKRLILDTVPERPSTRVLRRTGTQQSQTKKGFEASLSMLPADLDWITMRALEKDRLRRYPQRRTSPQMCSGIWTASPCWPAHPASLTKPGAGCAGIVVPWRSPASARRPAVSSLPL